jgi:hypothetical protein
LNLGVVLGQLLLLVRKVVKSTLVGLRVSVLATVNVATLAGILQESDFLSALPAFIRVALNNIWLASIETKNLFVAVLACRNQFFAEYRVRLRADSRDRDWEC